MKTAKDPRHLERIHTMQQLFASEFPNPNPPENHKTAQIIENLNQIDELIKLAAPTWPIEKINKIDLAILRQAVYELTIESKAPPKVVVDEAVELAKEYGSDSSASFINGALGKLISDQQIETV
jgi:transcription antitermination factor NusB